MNKDILCLYYSRTGHTKFAMEEIAAALDCECVEMRDRVDRDGAIGWLRCGLDAMRRRTRAMEPFDTRRALQDYRLVILGTPIWAGRCSSIARGFLKRRGLEVQNIAYVVVTAARSCIRMCATRWTSTSTTPTWRTSRCASARQAITSGATSSSAM